VSDWLTRAILAAPWLAGLLWLVLHGADWTLTLKGARMRRELLAATGATEKSDYELNPLFKADVARLRFFAPRFVATWVGGAIAFPVLFYAMNGLGGVAELPGFTTWVIGALLGMLLFTRLSIIGRHLRNVFLFARLLRPPGGGAPQPIPQFDGRTNLMMSVVAFGEGAALLIAAAALSLDPWITGGAAGLVLLAAKHLVLAMSARAARAG
jgi:hypothetical protein